MIAAAVQKTTPWWQNLSFNWFDVAILAVLAFGFWRGRKRGMSREALPAAFWVVAVAGAGFGYQPLGDLLQSTGYLRKMFGTAVNEHTLAYVICYLFIVIVAFIIYSMVAKLFREKVSGSNAFGGGEYYLGIIAGMIRYACIAIFFLALLSAPYYSQADILAQKAYNNRWYGGGLQGYSGDFIPSVAEVQASVFKTSLAGPVIQNNLGMLLIQSAAPGKKTVHKK
ncbi:MAG: CvpA family protein [Verrucomicrobiae bacterium]|nr:CvpA family protein [Verrucomicrobiae bacterium]